MSTTGAILLAFLLASNTQHSLQEEQCLAYTVMREAGGEGKRSKRAVLDVLQHRMRKKRKSCKAVVSEPHQFSWYHRNIRMKVDKKHLQSFREAATLRPVLKSCSEWFHSGAKPYWAKRKKLVHKEDRLKFYC